MVHVRPWRSRTIDWSEVGVGCLGIRVLVGSSRMRFPRQHTRSYLGEHHESHGEWSVNVRAGGVVGDVRYRLARWTGRYKWPIQTKVGAKERDLWRLFRSSRDEVR